MVKNKVEEEKAIAMAKANSNEKIIRRILSTDIELNEKFLTFSDQISRAVIEEKAKIQHEAPDFSSYEVLQFDFTVSPEQFIKSENTSVFSIDEHRKQFKEWSEKNKCDLLNYLYDDSGFHGVYSSLTILLNSMLAEMYLREIGSYSIENQRLITEYLPITVESFLGD